MFDVIVVGAGLAGLTAAHGLRDLDLLVLEKEDRLGGRVLTRHRGRLHYEMGATLAYSPSLLPDGEAAAVPPVRSAPIGLYHEGRMVFADSPEGCLLRAFDGRPEILESLAGFRDGGLRLADLDPTCRGALSAFFRSIHPGPMEDYAPDRQRQDPFQPWASGHHPEGNEGLVRAYASRLPSGVVTGAGVEEVEVLDDGARVAYLRGGAREEARARALVVATPAEVTRELIPTADADCAAYLESVRYAPFTVAALGVDAGALDDFLYVVSDELPANSIYRRVDPSRPDESVLVFYYGGPQAIEAGRRSDEGIRDLSLDTVHRLGIGRIDPHSVTFCDVARWELGATVISERLLARWKPGVSRPARRVVLAGDYLMQEFPCGMAQAVVTGWRAAMQVRRLLDLGSAGRG